MVWEVVYVKWKIDTRTIDKLREETRRSRRKCLAQTREGTRETRQKGNKETTNRKQQQIKYISTCITTALVSPYERVN